MVQTVMVPCAAPRGLTAASCVVPSGMLQRSWTRRLSQEGRTSSHAAAEPSNGRQHAAEADDRAHRGGEEGSRRGDEGGARGAHDDRDRERDRDRDRGKGRRRERSESPDDRDRRRRRRRYSRSRSPDRDRCGGPPRYPVPPALSGLMRHTRQSMRLYCAGTQPARPHLGAHDAGALAVTSSVLPCAGSVCSSGPCSTPASTKGGCLNTIQSCALCHCRDKKAPENTDPEPYYPSESPGPSRERRRRSPEGAARNLPPPPPELPEKPEQFGVYRGRVTNIMDFGCFVELTGLRARAEGLVHLANISKTRCAALNPFLCHAGLSRKNSQTLSLDCGGCFACSIGMFLGFHSSFTASLHSARAYPRLAGSTVLYPLPGQAQTSTSQLQVGARHLQARIIAGT